MQIGGKMSILNPTIKIPVVPRCPKCNSNKITIFLDDKRKGFRCLDCEHEWGVIKL